PVMNASRDSSVYLAISFPIVDIISDSSAVNVNAGHTSSIAYSFTSSEPAIACGVFSTPLNHLSVAHAGEVPPPYRAYGFPPSPMDCPSVTSERSSYRPSTSWKLSPSTPMKNIRAPSSLYQKSIHLAASIGCSHRSVITKFPPPTSSERTACHTGVSPDVFVSGRRGT